MDNKASYKCKLTSMASFFCQLASKLLESPHQLLPLSPKCLIEDLKSFVLLDSLEHLGAEFRALRIPLSLHQMPPILTKPGSCLATHPQASTRSLSFLLTLWANLPQQLPYKISYC